MLTPSRMIVALLVIPIHIENDRMGGAIESRKPAMPVSMARTTDDLESTREKKLRTSCSSSLQAEMRRSLSTNANQEYPQTGPSSSYFPPPPPSHKVKQ